MMLNLRWPKPTKKSLTLNVSIPFASGPLCDIESVLNSNSLLKFFLEQKKLIPHIGYLFLNPRTRVKEKTKLANKKVTAPPIKS